MGSISLEARSTIQAIKAETEKWCVCETCKVVGLWDGLAGRVTGEQAVLPQMKILGRGSCGGQMNQRSRRVM